MVPSLHSPSNRNPSTGYTQALLSERVRPRPPPSNKRSYPYTRALPPAKTTNSGVSMPRTPRIFASYNAWRGGRVAFSSFQKCPESSLVNDFYYFCSTGAAEDGRAPTEEFACYGAVWSKRACVRRGRPRMDALRQKSLRVMEQEGYVILREHTSVVALAGPSVAELTITDNDAVTPITNPIDKREFFVREHYLDSLNREPDTEGFQFWVEYGFRFALN